MALYEAIVLGVPNPDQLQLLVDRFAAVADDYGLDSGTELIVLRATDLAARDAKSTATVLYFGGDPAVDAIEVAALGKAKIPIIPIVQHGTSPTAVLPEAVRALNASFVGPSDAGFDALLAAALECLGLLRRQRRIFISYRRDDSRDMAVQLHDELSGAGFDVFLDTHDIRPGEPFQEMLWHRLADCDVVVMIDTPDYFGSKWTKQELGRSLAQGIHILRLVWPGHVSNRHLSLSDTVVLTASDLTQGRQLTPPVIMDVVARAERLRSRSVATRHMSIAGALTVEIERIGGVVEGIGPHRAIVATLPHGRKILAYPVVGVPTAELLNEVHDRGQAADPDVLPCLVYNPTGIRPSWLEHLDWLDARIKEVRGLKVLDAGWELAAWDS